MFDGVEELDFVGPLEVFGVASRLKPDTIHVFTLEAEGGEIQGAHGLRVKPEYSFQSYPKLDVLVVPGGKGARREMQNLPMLTFVKRVANRCELVTSVCTGALILAIDMAPYVIASLYGHDVSEQVAHRMEYRMISEAGTKGSTST